jgi:hypothetical protein
MLELDPDDLSDLGRVPRDHEGLGERKGLDLGRQLHGRTVAPGEMGMNVWRAEVEEQATDAAETAEKAAARLTSDE